MNQFMIDYNKIINEMKEFIKNYESIFVIDELEKWIFTKYGDFYFSKEIFDSIDILDKKIKEEKQYLKLIADRLSIYIDKERRYYRSHILINMVVIYMTKNRYETLKEFKKSFK